MGSTQETQETAVFDSVLWKRGGQTLDGLCFSHTCDLACTET